MWRTNPVVCILIVTVGVSFSERFSRQGLFNIVTFPNLPCRGDNGLNGTCVPSSTCFGQGGEAQGACAQGFGTCCQYTISDCGGTITKNQTYIQNPGYPSIYTVSADTTCTFTIERINNDVCQVRFDFETFDIGPPYYSGASSKRCESGNTDDVTFTPGDGSDDGIELCGYNPGQHVYIDMGVSTDSPNTAKMIMKFDASHQSDYNRKYNIMASQIECNTNYYAPKGCHQYFFGNEGTGTIQAFNYDQTSSDYIARLRGYYTVCVRREQDMCLISYTPPDIDTDSKGFSVSGNPSTITEGRGACGNPAPNQRCGNSFIRIPQGTTSLGIAPYLHTAPPGAATTKTCDRFCGQRLCQMQGACEDADHQTIYSRLRPFRVYIEYRNVPPTQTNKGHKFNYAQYRC